MKKELILTFRHFTFLNDFQLNERINVYCKMNSRNLHYILTVRFSIVHEWKCEVVFIFSTTLYSAFHTQLKWVKEKAHTHINNTYTKNLSHFTKCGSQSTFVLLYLCVVGRKREKKRNESYCRNDYTLFLLFCDSKSWIFCKL